MRTFFHDYAYLQPFFEPLENGHAVVLIEFLGGILTRDLF